jgi:hypothetical protein
MDAAQIADLVWTGGALVIVAMILVTRRARRHGGSLRAGVVGALYDLLNEEKRRALDVIVEGKAEVRRPEYPDGNLPDLAGGGVKPKSTAPERKGG